MKDLFKKIGSILVCISLVGALAACGEKSEKNYGNKINKKERIEKTEKPQKKEKTKVSPDFVPSETAEVIENTNIPDSTENPVSPENIEVTINPTENVITGTPDVAAPVSTEAPAVIVKPENYANEEVKIKTVAEGYLKATANVDAVAALKYVDKNSYLYSEVEEGAMTSILESLSETMPEESVKEIEPAVTKVINAMKENSRYQIGAINYSGDTATVTYTLTTIDVDSGMEDAQKTVEADFMTKYTEEEINAMANDEKQMMNFMTEMMKALMEETAKTKKTKTISGTLSIQKINGNWLVVDKETGE